MKLPPLLLCGLVPLVLTACIPILIHSAVEADSSEKAAYSAYRDTQAKINSDRELAHLPTNAVLTRLEWKASLGTRTNDPSLKPPRAP